MSDPGSSSVNPPARLIIRPEEPTDRQAIHTLVAEAFGRLDEADLVDGLRQDGDLILSYVAVDADGTLYGHAALSRLQSPADALALAPVSVALAFQRKGIGSRLIRVMLIRAHQQGHGRVFVLGDPAYYTRFGFSAAEAEAFSSPYEGPHFMALRLNSEAAEPAPVIYAAAFSRLG